MIGTEIEALDPVTSSTDDVETLQRLEMLLEKMAQGDRLSTFVDPDGQTVALPASLYHILRRVVPLLAHGESVAVVPTQTDMTTQEAADFLNMSRPSLVKLLEDGTIPHSKVGTHRRVRFVDVLAYKKQRSEGRKELLNEMLAVAQEHNAYD